MYAKALETIFVLNKTKTELIGFTMDTVHFKGFCTFRR
jgi:hypothetical protein